KKKKSAAEEPESEEGGGSPDVEVNALELEAAARGEAPEEEDDEEPIQVSGEDAIRADLAASGAEMFDDEDDDDQPLLGGPASDAAPSQDLARRQEGQGGVVG